MNQLDNLVLTVVVSRRDGENVSVQHNLMVNGQPASVSLVVMTVGEHQLTITSGPDNTAVLNSLALRARTYAEETSAKVIGALTSAIVRLNERLFPQPPQLSDYEEEPIPQFAETA